MKAVVLEAAGKPLRAVEMPRPEPGEGQRLIRVEACGVCRTDLHLRDGEVSLESFPRVLGHQIVGVADGERVGVPWLAWTCGQCRFCRRGQENLCVRARFTGRDVDGGFAEWAVADSRYCLPIPDGVEPLEAAPLLCAGLIGFRALRMTGGALRLGLYGFGSAAHIICQVAVHEGRRVFAFTRSPAAQALARSLGAEWAGSASDAPPEPLDAALLFAPAGEHVPLALRAVDRGGVVVCAGIHMSDIPSFPYADLWGERTLRSVANLTRADGAEFLALAPRVPVRTRVTSYALADAEAALADLRAGRLTGAAVVRP